MMNFGANKDLPSSVTSVIPDAAQTVWRNAFNGADATLPPKNRSKVAWHAVRGAGWRQSCDGKWAADSALALANGTKLERVSITERIVFDADAKMRRTPDGFLVAQPRVARTGIQVYKGREVGRPEMDEVRVYRPEAEVFSRDAMHSFAHRPMTMDHPPVLVTADNWKKFAIGQTGDEVLRDGDFLRVPMVLMDADAIARVEDGKRELSAGYTMDFKWEAGRTAQGEAYDAVQAAIRANHIAVVDMARGGPKLNLADGDYAYDGENESLDESAGDGDNGRNDGDPERGEDEMTTLKTITVDGLSVEMTDMAANVVTRFITGLQGQIDKFTLKQKETEEEAKKSKDALTADHTKLIGEKDAKITTLEKQLKDAQEGASPAALDALVKDRATVVGLGRALIGDKLVTADKSANDIRRQVVDAIIGGAAKDWKDSEVRSSFDTLAAGARTSDSGGSRGHAHRPGGDQYGFPQNDAVANVLRDGLEPNGLDHYDLMEGLYDQRDQRLEDAYRFPHTGGVNPNPPRRQ